MKNKNKNNQKGFGILEILLIVVTLSFVIAIASVVTHHQKTQKQQQAVQHNLDLSKVLQIKEWNVYLQLPDTTSKVGYKLASADDIVLSSADLDKLAVDHPQCSQANQYVHIQRSKTAPAQVKNKQIGLYYYFEGAKPSVSPCYGSDIPTVQQLINQVYDLWDKLPTYQNIVLNP